VAVTDKSLITLFELLPLQLGHLRELNLSSNHMTYFSFDALIKALKTGKLYLNRLLLSNTKLFEASGVELIEAVVSSTRVRHLDLSRNQGLSYKFSAYALYLVKNRPQSQLSQLELSYTSVSQLHYRQI
jgi:hypothetical protein